MITALAFLKHILPDQGHYAAFVHDTKQHIWRTDLAQLADSILEQDQAGRTVYHACAAFRTPSSRKQSNALGAKALWGDIDIAPKSKYADAIEAAEHTQEVCIRRNLPAPLYVGSGGGLHIYWPFISILGVADWRILALGLKALCQAEGLELDPTRTGDIASILRTPGTHNRKDGLIRPVQCGPLVGPYPIEAFEILKGYSDDKPASPAKSREKLPALAAAVGNTFETEPRYAEIIADHCGQLANFREKRGNLPEPEWYAGVGVCAFCEDGREFANKYGDGHETYSEHETNERLERASRLSGATTCEHFHSLNPKTCEACEHWGRIKSPIVLGRREEPIKPAEPNPALPHDFFWSGQSLITRTGTRGGTVDIVISTYPIYLDAVQTGEIRGEWTYVFKQYIPSKGWFDIGVSGKVLFGQSSASELADRGANIHEHAHFIRYARAAIDLHYRRSRLSIRYEQFGWKNDDTAFLYGLDLYTMGGVERVTGNDELQIRCKESWVGPATGGSLDAWKAAVNALFVSGCEPQSVCLVASFAAPLMRFQERDEGGAIIHLVTRESGTGKSTALIGAASVWGRREGLGLTNDDTRISKALTLGALGNLPVIHDELTIRDPEVIKNFVINFTNGRDKMRATRFGEIRHTASTWQTLLLSAANTSLVDALTVQGDPEAAAMRVMEFRLEIPEELKHSQGDRLRAALRANSGHAGVIYMNWIVHNVPWIKAQLAILTDQIWQETKFKSPMRFWVRSIAAIALAGLIVKELGLIEFSVDRIIKWLMDTLVSQVESGAYTRQSPNVGLLALFLNEHRDCILAMPRPFHAGEKQRPSVEPKRKLLIRYEESNQKYFIAHTAFREWLVKKERSFNEVLAALDKSGVVLRQKCLMTLGAGSDIPGGQVACVEINGAHPDLGGVPAPASNVISIAQSLSQR